MSLISFDSTKCHKDQICVKSCPVGIIELPDDKQAPNLIVSRENWCLKCGHCETICPHNAVSLNILPEKNRTQIDPTLEISIAQLKQFMQTRRSIRCFKEDPVPKESILSALEIAQYAPSAKNGQPVQWTIFYQTYEVRNLTNLVVDWMQECVDAGTPIATLFGFKYIIDDYKNGKDKICRHAPHLIVAHAPAKNRFAATDAIIALAHLELALHGLKIGACWAGFFQMAATQYRPLQEKMGINKDQQCLGCLMIGFPAFKYKKIPVRNSPNVTWK